MYVSNHQSRVSSMARLLVMLILAFNVILEAQSVNIARSLCKPDWGMKNATCSLLMQECWNRYAIKLKWTDAGITGNGGRRHHDAGCQCDQYCGFQTSNGCNKDKQCFWKQMGRTGGACFNRLSGRKGTAMNRVCPVAGTFRPSTAPSTASPSTAPTTSTPSTSPTTSIPTNSPSKAPTTPVPTSSPTTNPTTSTPTRTPSTNPTTSVPSIAPSNSPTTSVPTFSPSRPPTFCGRLLAAATGRRLLCR